MARTVAILPMKAHSERVSGKNFRQLVSKPLFRWILDSLLEVEAIDQIIINTDAREMLADKGLETGFGGGKVLVRDRRPEICGDFVPMNTIIADDMAAAPADTYLMTHTTNPFLSAKTIGAALGRYLDGRAAGVGDSLFTVTKIQTRFYRADGSAVNHDPKVLLRTQDLEPWFEENSNLYIFSAESFAVTDARIGTRPLLFETPLLEAVDIDTPDQWALAEAVGTAMLNKGA